MVAKRVPAKRVTTKPVVRKTTTKPVARKVAEKTLESSIKKVKIQAQNQRVHILANIAWEERNSLSPFGAKWDSDLRQFVFIGTQLPKDLTKYRTEEFSLERWIEDEINGYQPITTSKNLMTPRPHQVTAIKRIRSAAQGGYRGFINADSMGLGKTVSSLVGASEAATVKGFTSANPAKLLIICPKAVIPHWRNTIRALGVTNLRIIVINYDRTKNLLTVPSSAQTAKRTRTKNKNIANDGNPLIKWDIIIGDESHKLKNIWVSQRSKAFDKIAEYSIETNKAPFVIWATATVGQDPTELGYLAPLIGQLSQQKLTLKNYGSFLVKSGFHVVASKVGVNWVTAKPADSVAKKNEILAGQKEDIERMRQLLFSPQSPSIRRNPEDIANWPEINRIPMPYQLEPSELANYMKAWLEFRSFLKLNPRGKNPNGALAAQTRFRQKASIVMIPKTLDFALDLLDNGLQVAISVQFIETLKILKSALEKKGYTVSEFSGDGAIDREQERLDFQKGKNKVIIFTVEEGVSFHAGEQLADGSLATAASRATILHDIRYSAISCAQIEGRCHRDGQSANIYYPYAQGTVQYRIIQRMIQRMANMKNLSGDDASIVLEIENLLDEAALT